MIDAAVVELIPIVGAKAPARPWAVPGPATTRRTRSGRCRWDRPPAPAPRKRQPRALTAAEQTAVLDVLHCERFVDAAPEAVYATLLDEGVYLVLDPHDVPAAARPGRDQRWPRPPPARHPPRT